MQIADSAFACWCLTFPLEVAHRLDYAPPICSLSENTCYPPRVRRPPPIPLQHVSSAPRLFRGSLDERGSLWGGRGGLRVMPKFDERCSASFLLRHVSENHLCRYHFLPCVGVTCLPYRGKKTSSHSSVGPAVLFSSTRGTN